MAPASASVAPEPLEQIGPESSRWAAVPPRTGSPERIWRPESDLLAPDAARQIAFFARNAQGLLERVLRSLTYLFVAPLVPLVEAARAEAGPRLLGTLLRGMSRDRLDHLGEEYFRDRLRPRLRPGAVAELRAQRDAGESILLVSGWLDHVVRPLARELGLDRFLANRMEFRSGRATGRLRGPVVTSRRAPGWQLRAAVSRTARPTRPRRAVLARTRTPPDPLSVRTALAGREILLIGATGFIGKVWLAKLIRDVDGLGRLHLLIRPRGAQGSRARFERLLRTSPVLEGLDPARVARMVRIVEGDASRPDLGLAPETAARLRPALDLIVNSGGSTEFNPDLRTAVAANVDATREVVGFQRSCARAALLHLSTCFVAGQGDGRVAEELVPDYTPAGSPDFEVDEELERLHHLIAGAERVAEGGGVVGPLRARGRVMSAEQLRKAHQRWLRAHLAAAGTQRARLHGWPNTYCFTKSLGESWIARHGAGLPIAVVRPSIVESTAVEPFPGWNEGVNTSAPLSHLIGTVFRQLPTRRHKSLDVIPVDLVARGMTLIAAALVERRHAACYQLATSASNPLAMRRAIELTALAHRRYWRARPGLRARLRAHLETIPVSRRRYRTFSVPRLRRAVSFLRRVCPVGRGTLRRWERALGRVEKIIELFEPFIHDNDLAFAADRVMLLDAVLPEAERPRFGYAACEQLDWPAYWIDVHIPALRRWAYPLIEGRPPEA